MTTTDQTAHDVIAEPLADALDCTIDMAQDIAHHIAEHITAAGYAVVRLPEPDSISDRTGLVRWVSAGGDVEVFPEGGVAVWADGGDSPYALRDFAAALLAAADHQEKNQ